MTDLIKSENYIKEHKNETIETILKFAKTDLLFFWSDNKEVFLLQKKIWQKFLDDLQNKSKVNINVSKTLQVPDNKDFCRWLENELKAMTAKKLTAEFLTATQLKSVILGLAMLEKEISVAEIFNAAFLEEIYQNKKWGVDDEALQGRKQIKSELQQIKEYLS